MYGRGYDGLGEIMTFIYIYLECILRIFAGLLSLCNNLPNGYGINMTAARYFQYHFAIQKNMCHGQNKQAMLFQCFTSADDRFTRKQAYFKQTKPRDKQINASFCCCCE